MPTIGVASSRESDPRLSCQHRTPHVRTFWPQSRATESWMPPAVTASRTSLSSYAPLATMRTFVAINLPPHVREAIYDDAAPLRAAADAVRWVAARSLHTTVKFIGELSDPAIDDVRRALERVAFAHPSVVVETTRLGAFPNFRRPRVVWVGMTREAELRALARDVDAALAVLGIASEARPFQA